MAEFTDIMEQAKRMCETHKNCSRCVLYWVHNNGGCAFDYLLHVNFDEIERRIRTWTEKHPNEDRCGSYIKTESAKTTMSIRKYMSR